MKTIGKHEYYFPETPEEAETWIKTTRVYPLASRVLIVANTRIEGAWCCYADAVQGMDHQYEYQEVLATGSKVSERIARAVFPEFEGIPYAS
jgi:hypothetical protein